MLRFITLATALILCVVGTVPVEAKVYIWKDADNRTHYCNDPDDVPAEYKEKVRTIESQASSNEPSERTAVTPQQQAQPEAIRAAAVPGSRNNPMTPPNSDELNELMNNYRTARQEMRDFRQGGGSLDSPEYNDLKNKLVDIKRQINEARKRQQFQHQN